MEKSQSTYKNCIKIEKAETHAGRKRAGSALSRERMLNGKGGECKFGE